MSKIRPIGTEFYDVSVPYGEPHSLTLPVTFARMLWRVIGHNEGREVLEIVETERVEAFNAGGCNWTPISTNGKLPDWCQEYVSDEWSVNYDMGNE